MTSESVYLLQLPFDFAFLCVGGGCSVAAVYVLISLLPQNSPLFPKQCDDANLPSVPRELVILTRAVVTCAIVVITLNTAPLCAESPMEKLTPPDIVLLSNQ